MSRIFVAPARAAGGVVALAMGLACASAAMAQTVPPGPPQFFSAPLHAPEQNQARIQGWLDFAAAQSNRTGGDPPAQDAESSAFAGEQSGFAPVGVSNNSNAPYQGEPAITASPATIRTGWRCWSTRWPGPWASRRPS